MAENGYDALAALGQGAYLLLKLKNAGLTQPRQNINLPTAEWIPIGQITGDLNITFETTEHDITGADEHWARFVPGHNRISTLSIPIWFNPDLAVQSWRGDLGLDTQASLFYAYNHREIRTWRIFTQQEEYRGRAAGEFDAFIRQMPVNIPDGNLMRLTLNLRVTGPFLFKQDLSSDQRIIQDYEAPRNLTRGE